MLTFCSRQQEAIGERPHLLFISADSLRTDRLRLWNPAASAATPNLQRLAERGTRFGQMWAVTPWTAPSMVSAFTGLYPPSHGVVYRDDTTPKTLPTLARLLDAAGYRVGNFSFFSGISYFRNLGFPPPERGLRHGREPRALAAWLDGGDGERPFFAWVHLLEAHLPYGASGYQATQVQVEGSSGLEAAQLRATVPVGSVSFADGDRRQLIELYDEDVARLDLLVGELLEVLEQRGLSERTVVVFVADHGEELLEQGWVGHASTAVEAKLLPEILRIPLLLAGPGVPVGEESLLLGQHVDLLPTLLPLLGVDPPPQLDGLPLLPVRERGWGRLRSLLLGAPRRSMVYFDSSVGGNLTPPERRVERIQGISDGECLLVSHTLPGEERSDVVALGPRSCDARRLAEGLGRWRQAQLERRLALLREHAQGGAPPASEIDEYSATIILVEPNQSEAMEWKDHSGQLVVEWKGEGQVYWVEYDLGRGPIRVTGAFEVEQRRVVFGPFPRGFWNDLAGYSPFRFRVADAGAKTRSVWREFTVVAVENG